MANIRRSGSTKGTVFDLPHAMSLQSEDCNVLLVSSRTLYFIQALGLGEVGFVSRYASEFLENSFYVVADSSQDLDDINDIRNGYGVEVVDVSCDMVQAINDLTAVVSASVGSSCGCEVGSDVETTNGELGGVLPDPVGGLEYDQPDPLIQSRRCKSANYIHNSIRDVVDELKLNRADTYAFAGLTFVLTLVATIVGGLVAGPFGLLAGAAAGAFLSMAVKLFKASFSLTLLHSAIVADEDAAICALFLATTADDATAAYLAHLVTEGATSAETEFVELMMTTNVMNLLFFEWGDSAEAIEATPVTSVCDCGCAFGFSFGSGTPTYDDVEFVVSSSLVSGSIESLRMFINCAAGCSGNWCVEFVSTTIDVTPTVNYSRQLKNTIDASCTLSPQSDFAFPVNPAFPPFGTPVILSDFQFTDDAPFTVTMKIKPGIRGFGDGTKPYDGTNGCS